MGGDQLTRELSGPRAASTLTDLGAENVRSSAATLGSRGEARRRSSGSRGIKAGEERAELRRRDAGRQAEPGRAGAQPLPRGLAATGVVVVGALGDLLLVVAVLAERDLADREHRPGQISKTSIC